MSATIAATGAQPQAIASGLKRILALAMLVLLAACAAIPRGGEGPPPVVSPDPLDGMHRVALLLPLTGPDGDVGLSLANATALALTDTKSTNIQLTTYDTNLGVTAATNRAVADGNKVILGPLRGDQVLEVANIARPKNIPILSFSNDIGVAGRNVFLLGHLPNQSIDRAVRYARMKGFSRFGALVPKSTYGQRAYATLTQSVRAAGGTLVGVEEVEGGAASVDAATKRLSALGAMDVVLVADSGRAALVTVPALRRNGLRNAKVLGTDLWNIDGSLASNSTMYGAWFASVSDTLYNQYAAKYRTRFGRAPLRLSSLGYDSILLMARVARNWRPGTAFPVSQLTDPQGFIGVDGAFRFMANGLTERMLEVQEIQAGKFVTIDPAPTAFAK
ncbi:MAG TPA: penicillin-binding protein activator [Sphingorhabdus lacus]|jgi:branched-chain amino acid transport system substrate-binding protein|uniref:Penicillin-binding protein activator n=1 Tax=Sphingorhabdus lacus TaxID=392610 RepID=A0A6I6L3K2_9SPHN|nr:penicillin-binding protein activator [Sphingorhabdus lacus]QGY80530.1 penicillin-binding protein activator [Sphingorhabdus lacus]HNW16930.1 penicillin-binding protein activator [Sphingorhabdus lacus]HPV67514.1 penicillin-binding protein activator [Sphingorhabdus lacus]